MVAKASGISDRPGRRPALVEADSSTGIRSASAATLFMKADRPAPIVAMMAMWLPRLRPLSTTMRTIQATAPELTSPREMTSTIATTMVAGWPKPANAASRGTTPTTVARISAVNATRS